MVNNVSAQRVSVIDILRGMTMAAMIVANELAKIEDLPRWMYHASIQEERVTPVDFIFPLFLFWSGASLALSLERQTPRGSRPRIAATAMYRATTLIAVGILLANRGKVTPIGNIISKDMWSLLVLTGAFLVWVRRSCREGPAAYRIRVTAGFVVLLAAAYLCGTRQDGRYHNMLDMSYPDVLGLSGYSYATVVLIMLYVKTVSGRILCCGSLIIMNCVQAAGHLSSERLPPIALWWPGNCSHTALMLVGAVVSQCLFAGIGISESSKGLFLVRCVSVTSGLGSVLARPLGVSKHRATPSWTLGGICVATTLLTGAVSRPTLLQKGTARNVLREIGANPLLFYLLPKIGNVLIHSVKPCKPAMRAYVRPGRILGALLFSACVIAVAIKGSRLNIQMKA